MQDLEHSLRWGPGTALALKCWADPDPRTYAAVHEEPHAALHEGFLAKAKVPQRLEQLLQHVGRRRARIRLRIGRPRRIHSQRGSAQPPAAAQAYSLSP